MEAGIKTYKKTATIDAIQWNTHLDTYDITVWGFKHGVVFQVVIVEGELKMLIPTLEGPMHASLGDFIAKGADNEFWAIKPDIMEKTYQEV